MIPVAQFRGVDRRRPRGVGDPRRLWNARNVAITPGGRIERRPPQRFFAECSRDIQGLAFLGGRLRGWHGLSPAPTASTYPGADVFTLHSVRIAGKELDAILAAGVIDAKIYTVARYSDGSIQHWFGADRVADDDCPQTAQVTFAAERVFAVDGEVTRFCKAGMPSDWTGTDNAGFLPTGRVQGGSGAATALTGWRENLAVFYEGSVQIWRVGLDPVKDHALVDVVRGIGTRWPGTVAAVGDMVVFLAEEGYRAIRANEFGRAVIVEIGEEIDSIVADPDRLEDPAQRAAWSQGLSQYINLRGGRLADVLQIGMDSGRRDWTFYDFASPVAYPTPVGARMYYRDVANGSIVYLSGENAEGDLWRDQYGDERGLTTPVTTDAERDAALPARGGDGADGTRYATGSTPEADEGPSATNELPFFAWPVAGDGVTLALARELVQPGGLAGPVQYEFRYLAQSGGSGQVRPGAWVEGSRTLAGDDWFVLGVLAGSEYEADLRKGDQARDAFGNSFTVADDGGWRIARIHAPSGLARIRLRTAMIDGGEEEVVPPGDTGMTPEPEPVMAVPGVYVFVNRTAHNHYWLSLVVSMFPDGVMQPSVTEAVLEASLSGDPSTWGRSENVISDLADLFAGDPSTDPINNLQSIAPVLGVPAADFDATWAALNRAHWRLRLTIQEGSPETGIHHATAIVAQAIPSSVVAERTMGFALTSRMVPRGLVFTVLFSVMGLAAEVTRGDVVTIGTELQVSRSGDPGPWLRYTGFSSEEIDAIFAGAMVTRADQDPEVPLLDLAGVSDITLTGIDAMSRDQQLAIVRTLHWRLRLLTSDDREVLVYPGERERETLTPRDLYDRPTTYLTVPI